MCTADSKMRNNTRGKNRVPVPVHEYNACNFVDCDETKAVENISIGRTNSENSLAGDLSSLISRTILESSIVERIRTIAVGCCRERWEKYGKNRQNRKKINAP